MRLDEVTGMLNASESAQGGSRRVQQDDDPFLLHHLRGTSRPMVQLRAHIARLNTPRSLALVRGVLIRGESGTGKNYVAEVIAGHRQWLKRRSTAEDLGLEAALSAHATSFGEVHLPALPESLAESELFGVLKGAYTGADRDRTGLLGGPFEDILLDEIGDISAGLQAKLLRVTQDGQYRPVGGALDDVQTTSARLLFATNRDLALAVGSGQFREDLFWRLNEYTIEMVPLRDQPENIKPTIARIVGELRRELPQDLTASEADLTATDLRWAERYRWPGNVRQLRHCLKRWILENGARSLEEIAIAVPYGAFAPARAGDASQLNALVLARISAAEQGTGHGYRTPIDLVSEFEALAKGAVSRWYRTARPDEATLHRVFSEGKTKSIRTKLAEWRRHE
jgi:transcriptional regulator with GAF, ATPase, and Fis domain